jgi:hypothetical protein
MEIKIAKFVGDSHGNAQAATAKNCIAFETSLSFFISIEAISNTQSNPRGDASKNSENNHPYATIPLSHKR